MIYEVSLSSGEITEYETLESLLSMLNEDSSIDDSVFFQSLHSAQHKQRAIEKENKEGDDLAYKSYLLHTNK